MSHCTIQVSHTHARTYARTHTNIHTHTTFNTHLPSYWKQVPSSAREIFLFSFRWFLLLPFNSLGRCVCLCACRRLCVYVLIKAGRRALEERVAKGCFINQTGRHTVTCRKCIHTLLLCFNPLYIFKSMH